MTRWLRHAFWFALGLSLILHLGAVLAEPVYAWLTRPEFAETELRKVSKALQAQAVEEEDRPEALRGVKPADQLVVGFMRQVPMAATAPSPAAKKVRAVASRPVAVRASATMPLAASAVAVASAPAASTASGAQASAVQVASVVHAASAPQKLAASRVRASTVARAQEESVKRFPRDVKITYVWGSVPAYMHWQIGQDAYQLDVVGAFGFKSRTFHSHGRVTPEGIVPQQFREFRDKNPEPKYQVDFDWEAMKVQVGEPGQRKEEELHEGDQDLFSAAFHLALVGGKPQTMSLYTGRKRYPDIRFEPAGEATLTIGRQQVDAVLVRGQWEDRKVDFWLAPQWNNLPVRMTVNIPKEGSFDIWANVIMLDGQLVLEGPKPGQPDSMQRRP